MSFFCCFHEAAEAFSPQRHAQIDGDILALAIHQRSGEPARADVTLPCRDRRAAYAWVSLSFRDPSGRVVPLFQGKHLPGDEHIEGQAVTLRFQARSETAEQDMRARVRAYRTGPQDEPLFWQVGDEDSPERLTLLHPVVWVWDPVGGQVTLQSLETCRQVHEVTPFVDRDSLAIQAGEPAPALALTLEAEWIQTLEGYLNVGQMVRRLFPGGDINTFTGKSFAARWPQLGQFLRRSGYRVVASHLVEKPAPSLEEQFSPLIWRGGEPEPVRLKRTWFDARLVVAWTLHQRRLERIHVGGGPTHPKNQTLVVRLADVMPEEREDITPWAPGLPYTAGAVVQVEAHTYLCQKDHASGDTFEGDQDFWQAVGEPQVFHPASPSFFLTPRGHQAVLKGLDVLKAHQMRVARRQIYVTLVVPLAAFPDLRVEDRIRFQDPRLGPDDVSGVVLKTHSRVDGKAGHATLEIMLARIPDGASSWSAPPVPLEAYGRQVPTDRWARLGTRGALREDDFIDTLHMRGNPSDQARLLVPHQTPDNPLNPAEFQMVQTHIGITFTRLISREVVEHDIWVP